MRIKPSIIRLAAVLGVAVGFAVAAGAYDTPKPGLWTMTVTASGIPRPMASKSCVGAPKPGDIPFAPPPRSGLSCTKTSLTTTATGLAVATTCTAESMTIAMTGKITGDLTTSYTNVMTTRVSGPNLPPGVPTEHSMTLTAKYLGACPAGMAPNTSRPG